MADYSVTYDQLDALLQGLDPNTTATPYGVKLTEVTAEFLRGKGNPIAGTLQYVLQQNQSKYISLTFGTGCSAVLESLADASYMFFDCKSLTSVDVSGMTSVTDANTMFGRCTKLTSVDASGMTSVTNASGMFFGCTNLVSVDISGMTSVTNTHAMFQNCNLMTSVDVSDMTSVTIASSMFGSCASLTSVNASGMTSVTIASSMFIDCTNLVSVDISGMTAVTDASLMFGYCSSLEEIHGWQIPLTANATSCFKGCSSLRVVYVPDTRPTPSESSWRAWDIRKDTANNQSTVTVYNPDGTSNSVSVPSSGTYTMKVTDKVDELLFSPSEGIPAATIQKMLQTKAPITAKDALDPTKDNFMLLAKDRASARTNVTTDVIEAGNKLPPTSEAVRAAIGGSVPVGSMIGYPGSVAPDGWHLCIGETKLRSDYPSIVAWAVRNDLIGEGKLFGAGDGITTFVFPDLRELVLVGAGKSARPELDATGHAHDVYAVGEFKDDQLQNITGSVTSRSECLFNSRGGPYTSGAFQVSGSNSWCGGDNNQSGASEMTFNASRVARTGNVTHGKQIGMNYIIKI